MSAHEGHVHAVLVGSLRSPYLPDTLAALAAQTRRPGQIILAGLDGQTAETDRRWQDLIVDSGLDPAAVRTVSVAHAATFGGAVRRALTAVEGREPPTEAPPERQWLWLLHDDSAPQEQALEYLLGAVDVSNAIAVAGAKQVEWDDPDRLVSVGVRATRWGHRFTGIEEAEVDQGQHDGTDDVLAVGTAGMLIEASLWQELGGPDPALGPFEDGRDLSQRARLAGHRVVVVPRARVRHARARYRGLRARHASAAPGNTASDSRTSFRQRREATLRLRLTCAPAVAVPLLAVLAVLASLGRALWRVGAKEIGLALDELVAPWSVLSRPGLLAGARRRARSTRRLPTRRLRPLQATAGEVARLRRDRRLQAAAARRAARTPSELEIRERAIVAGRRRLALAAVLLISVGLSALTVAPTAFSGPLIGGSLLPSDGSFADLWHAANSTWINTSDGVAGPADGFLFVLVLVSGLTGGPLGVPVQISLALLLVLAMPLAALTGWLGAGAATRSIMLRAWAGLAWALGPALLIGIGSGRLGAIVAHLLLPLVLLGITRSMGLDRRDVVISGMIGARRVTRRSSRRAGRSPGAVKRARLAALAKSSRAERTDEPVQTEVTPQTDEPAQTEVTPQTDEPAQTDETVPSPEESPDREEAAATAQEASARESAPADGDQNTDSSKSGQPHAKPSSGAGPDWSGLPAIPSNTLTTAEPEPEESGAAVVSRVSRAPSLGAAAGAGLALAGAVAGAPVLLPAAVVALALVAVGLGRRKRLPASRGRLVLTLLPAFVLAAPQLLFAAGHDDGWRALFAGPGAPYASDPGPAWLQLLAWPQHPMATGLLPEPVGSWTPLAVTAVILLGAIVALFRGGVRVRPVRIGWLLVVVGLATALVSTHIAVAVGSGSSGAAEVVHGWAGPGTSLVLAGLLVAVLTGADGVRGHLSQANFGWRQLTAVAATVLVVLTVATGAIGFSRQVLQDRADPQEAQVMLLGPRQATAVPALGLEQQTSPQQSRVLMLTSTTAGVDAQLWRGNGPQLTETAAAAKLRQWQVRTGQAQDPAHAALASVVARVVSGSSDDVAAELAEHAVSVIVVPPAHSEVTGTGQVDRSGRAALIATLDAVAGVDRVTENSAGVIWRVDADQISPEGDIARVQVIDGDGDVLSTLPAGQSHLGGNIDAEGTGRQVVLADRADSGWRAWLGGRELRAGEDSWRQSFAIPDGAQGDLVIQHRPLWLGPWRIAAVVVGVLTVLLALPTRRRREEKLR